MNRNSVAVLVTGLAAMSWACGGGDGAAQTDAPAPEAPADAPAAAAPAPAGGADYASVVLPDGVTLEMVEAGAELWPTQICTTCHGAAGAGVTDLGPNLVDELWLNSDGSYEAIVATITNGVMEPQEFGAPMMPKGGMASITDEQVRQLAAYIYATGQN